MGKSDVRCPKCGRATKKVQLIYPRTDDYEEKRVRAIICPHCLYVFGESDVENNNYSFRNESLV
jgi:rubredoxin